MAASQPTGSIVPVPDPTANVQALNEATVRRIDDLTVLQDRLTDERITNLRREMELRAEHGKEIREIETARLNAVRDVDQLNRDMAANRAQIAIQTLESSNSATAQMLRELVDSTAKTIANQTAVDRKAVDERISALERTSYVGAGRSALSDPMMEKLVARMESLLESRATVQGKSTGLSLGASILIGGLGLLATIFGLLSYLK